MLRIRPMEDSDLANIVELEKDLYRAPWNKENYLYELHENPYAYYFVMINTENNDEIVGYIGFWIKFEFAEITKVSIAKKYQNHHLSYILLNDAINRIIKADCENITLEVRVSNTPAYKAYCNVGFKKVAVRPHYYDNGEDAYLMIKELK